jgi:TonB family protein
LSRVFDARKQAEHSKRTREAVTETTQLTKFRPHESDSRGAATTNASASDLGTTVAVAQQGPIVRSLLRVSRSEPHFVESYASKPVRRQSNKVEPVTLILLKDPLYPAAAKQNLVSGIVEVHFRISPEGKVYDVKSVKGSPILAQAAIQAVEGWHYEPARLNGAPIDSHSSTHFDFKLD